MRIFPGGVGKFDRRLSVVTPLTVEWLARNYFNSVNQTAYTASAQPLGAAAGSSERRFYVVGLWSSMDVAHNVASVTVRGQSGSQVAITTLSDVNQFEIMAMWVCEDTAPNTTGDVAITFDHLMSDCALSLWRITSGLAGIVLLDAGTSNTETANPGTITASLDVIKDGAQVALLKYRNPAPASPVTAQYSGAQRQTGVSVGDYNTSVSVNVTNATWTDLTEAFDVNMYSDFTGLANYLVTASWRPAS